MRYVIITIALLLVSGGKGYCKDPFRDFKENITRNSLRPFARDLGGILGSAVYNTGRSLGFSGFDVGFVGAMQFKPSSGNAVLKKAGVRSFGFPWIQAAIGMPFRLDGFIRGFNYQGLTVSGGGVRYGIRKMRDVPYYIHVMLIGVGNSVTHTGFSATHFGAGVVFSVNLPVVTPYFGAGVDTTKIRVKASTDSSFIGKDVSVTESRFTFGLHARIARFFYLSAAANMLHGRTGMESGIGIRF